MKTIALPQEKSNMKIGVVGLLPSQFKHLIKKLPQHDIHCLSRSREKPEQVVEFARNMDKVLLMVKFVAHTTTGVVDASKRIMITGGLSASVRAIREIDKAGNAANTKITSPTYPVRTAAPCRPIPQPQVAVSPAVPVTPKSSHVLMVQMEATGRYDYSVLDAAIPGDVARFMLPPDVQRSNWLVRLRVARTYYNKRLKYQLKLAVHDDYVDFEVIDRSAPAVAENALPPSIQPETPEIIPAIEQPETPEIIPAIEASAVVETEEERAMWREVFVACFRHTLEIEAASQKADAALAIYQERFKRSLRAG